MAELLWPSPQYQSSSGRFTKPMTCRKQPNWFKPLVRVTQDRSCERAKRNLCACACTKASLWSCVCVFVSMLGPQKANETVLGCRLFCSAFQNNQIHVDSEVWTGSKHLRRPFAPKTWGNLEQNQENHPLQTESKLKCLVQPKIEVQSHLPVWLSFFCRKQKKILKNCPLYCPYGESQWGPMFIFSKFLHLWFPQKKMIQVWNNIRGEEMMTIWI